MHTWSEDPASVRPMLATTADAPLTSPEFAYEPKYDGIRAIVAVDPGTPPSVRLWSRLGNEKTRQFPEVVSALAKWARTLDRPVVFDGEIVALDQRGEPVGFQNLQGRIHLRGPSVEATERIALITFDLLRDGREDLRPLPLSERRARLERVLGGVRDPALRISEQVMGDGRPLHERAHQQNWEGLIAKRLSTPYKSGRRSPDWRKLKLVRRQACVVGGWTAPRGSRPFLGALLLGVYDEANHLQYIGHTGAGFTDAELGRVWKRLQAIKTATSPFFRTPKTNERPAWVKPKLVVEVKFTEWTVDRKLRQPTYLGLRDDIKPESVRKEPDDVVRVPARQGRGGRPSRSKEKPEMRSAAAERARGPQLTTTATEKLIARIDEIEHGSGNGVLELPGGDELDVTNLGKVFWPARRHSGAGARSWRPLTKGDVFRHYIRVAPMILPALADRPLVMKRFPNGIASKPFYQHRAPDKLPVGVAVANVKSDREVRPHLIGSDLKTLLYTVQLASISQDPWFSRIGSEDYVDHVAIDLDPPDDLPFERVLDVARFTREELAALKAPGFPKTSGSAGLHIYIPMPPKTTYEAGLLFCQIIATIVARKHPKLATVERSVTARGRRIYVDYLQNIKGKTLASAYSVRANDFAGVSTPLTWDEVDKGVSPQDFTMLTFPDRIKAVGDPWAALRKSKGADLRAVTKYSR